MFAQKTYHYVKLYGVPNNVDKASDSSVTVNIHCLPQPFRHFENSTACAGVLLSIKRRADVM